VTDRAHNPTRLVYSTSRAHYLQQVIDPLGRTGTRTEYDDQGRLIRVFDALGNPVQLTHDQATSSETVTDALGRATTYQYDARGNVLTEVTALGAVTRRTFD